MREKGEFMQISHKAKLGCLAFAAYLGEKREAAMANPHVRDVAVPCHRTRTKSGVLAGLLPEGWKTASALHKLHDKLPDIRGFMIPTVDTDPKKWAAWAEQNRKPKKNKKAK